MQRALLMILFCFTSWSFAKAEEVPLDAWVGKDPFQEIGGANFFHHPQLQEDIGKLTGSKMPQSNTVRVPWPVRQADGLIVVQFCAAKECVSRNYALLVDMSSGDIGFCSYTESLSQMTYKLSLTYEHSNAVLSLNGTFNGVLPYGCLEQDTAKLAKIWRAYLVMAL